MSKIDDTILEIASQYAVNVHLNDEHCGHNEGGRAGIDIYLGEFDDKNIKLFAFFHELAHATFPLNGAKYHMSKLSQEGACWEYAIGLAAKHGYKYDYDSKELVYGRQAYYSYFKEHTNELKIAMYHLDCIRDDITTILSIK